MKFHSQHHTKEKLGSVSFRIRNKTGMLTLTTFIMYVLEVLATAVR